MMDGQRITVSQIWMVLAVLAGQFSSGHCQTTSARGEWPQWRGPNRDNISLETGLLQEWPEGGPPLLWTLEGIGEGAASVSVSGGKIFTVGYRDESEFAFAIDLKSGQLLWATRLGPAVSESPLMRWLSQRSPTIDGDLAWFVRTDGDLVCLKTADGVEVWRTSYPKNFGAMDQYWGFCDYPVVDGDSLVCAPGSPDAGLVSLNKRTGELRWKVPVPGVTRCLYGPVVAADFHGVRQFVAFSKLGIHGIGAESGKLLWSTGEFPSPYSYHALHTPAITGNDILVSNGSLMSLFRIEFSEGKFEAKKVFEREYRTSPYQDNLIVLGEHVFTFVRGGVPVCLSRVSGEEIWQGTGPPDNRDENVPLPDPDQSGRSDRYGGVSTAVYADGNFVVAHSTGVFRLIQASSERQIEKGVFSAVVVPSDVGLTSPVISQGRLIWRDDHRLYCHDLRQKPDADRATPGRHRIGSLGEIVREHGKAPEMRSVFVPTPLDVVHRMLEIVDLKQEDVVVDLGSGDGRILIASAKKYGCRAIGYELDEGLVRISRDEALSAGVGHLVTIEQQDLFAADLSNVDVLTLFLLPAQLQALKPQLEKMKPGSRIVSHQFAIPNVVVGDKVTLISDEDDREHQIYSWTTPLTSRNGRQ